MKDKEEIKAEISRILPNKRIRKNTMIHTVDYFIGYKQALRWVISNE